MRYDRIIVIATVILFPANVVAQRSSTSPVSVTVCGLVRHPEFYDHRLVVVRGKVIGGFHGMALVDHCPEGQGITLNIENEIAEHHDVSPVFDAVYREGFIGTSGKRITATFTGDFSYRKSDRFSRQLDVVHASDVKIKLDEDQRRARIR